MKKTHAIPWQYIAKLKAKTRNPELTTQNRLKLHLVLCIKQLHIFYTMVFT